MYVNVCLYLYLWMCICITMCIYLYICSPYCMCVRGREGMWESVIWSIALLDMCHSFADNVASSRSPWCRPVVTDCSGSGSEVGAGGTRSTESIIGSGSIAIRNGRYGIGKDEERGLAVPTLSDERNWCWLEQMSEAWKGKNRLEVYVLLLNCRVSLFWHPLVL